VTTCANAVVGTDQDANNWRMASPPATLNLMFIDAPGYRESLAILRNCASGTALAQIFWRTDNQRKKLSTASPCTGERVQSRPTIDPQKSPQTSFGIVEALSTVMCQFAALRT
jgi:hypothetical protein